jgi:hypothetical protein
MTFLTDIKALTSTTRMESQTKKEETEKGTDKDMQKDYVDSFVERAKIEIRKEAMLGYTKAFLPLPDGLPEKDEKVFLRLVAEAPDMTDFSTSASIRLMVNPKRTHVGQAQSMNRRVVNFYWH